MRHARRLAILCLGLLVAVASVAAGQGSEYIRAHYTKYEHEIPMRDGAKLFTAVFVPNDAARSYPILLKRTPYAIDPYGSVNYPDQLGPSELFAREGFIFAYQDVRGRFMSGGVFEDLRPHRPDKTGPLDIDESSDTWDTIEWLVKNVPNNSGRVGMWGISYDGFYVAAGMIDAHPALRAVSPQAPIGDCYLGDDCYHNGVLWLPHNFGFFTFFTERTGRPAPAVNVPRFDYGTPDGYEFYIRLGNVARSKALFQPSNPYWNNIVDHTTYDAFWKARSITRFFRRLPPAVLTVGGWFDGEDLAGALRVFRAADKVSSADNHLVMGPWRHGGWAREDGDRLGNLYFASKTAAFYRERIEFPFFIRHLKDAARPADDPGSGSTDASRPGYAGAQLAKAHVFETGSNRWRALDVWPPRGGSLLTLYLDAHGSLSAGQKPSAPEAFDEYVSDPQRPVPFIGRIVQNVPSDYMTEDQRFASRRPDVLVYRTEPLERDLTACGPVDVHLFVSTTGTDSDFVVKLIDVYPGEYPDPPPPSPESGDATTARRQRAASQPTPMGGYQQLVRGEPFRGKYRNGFDRPEPFEPGKMSSIAFTMPDICHTFRTGHRAMVHVQSSWFPLGDRNPQTFTDIPNAAPSDFRKATQRVYRSAAAASSITLRVER